MGKIKQYKTDKFLEKMQSKKNQQNDLSPIFHEDKPKQFKGSQIVCGKFIWLPWFCININKTSTQH